MNELQARVVRWVTGISLGLGLLVLLNQLQIPYYLYYPRTTNTMLISPTYDYYLFLITTACVPLAFAFQRKIFAVWTLVGTVAVWTLSLILTFFNPPAAVLLLYVTVICTAILSVLKADRRRLAMSEILPSTAVLLILVESSSLFYWMTAALTPQARFNVLSEQLEANLTFSLYPLSIVMMLLLLFSWLWIPIITRIQLRRHLVVRYQPSTSNPDVRSVAAALDLFAIVAIILFFYSYLAGQTWVVGVDSHLRYLDPLTAFTSLPQILQGSYMHGVYLTLLYLITATGASAFSVVKYAPLALAFATAATTFFAVLRGGWRYELAIITGLCSVLWLPTTLGIYAGIQDNWLAFIFWMLFLSIYFVTRNRNLKTYIILALLSLCIFLLHPWSWGVFATTLLLTTLISKGTTWMKHSTLAFLASLLPLPIGVGAYALSPSMRFDLAGTIRLYSASALNPTRLLVFGGALFEMFSNWGPFFSPTLLLFSIIGAYALSRRRGITANYMIAWIVTWCVGSILIAPAGFNPINVGISETGMWRMMYVSPLPFLLGLGFERSIRFFSASGKQVNVTEHASNQIIPLMLTIAPFIGLGAGLFMLWDPMLRLLLVIGGLALTIFLAFRTPSYRTLGILVTLLLALLLINVAFRSLFPLLLDPHNLFSSTPLPNQK
jgi:hypothetical protein